jgi:hypothetical protein
MRTRILVLTATAVFAGAGAASAQVTGLEVVKAFDKNGDGFVSKAEWEAAGRPSERFDPIDANRDGRLTAQEIDQALARLRAARGEPGPPAKAPPPPPPPASPPNTTPAAPQNGPAQAATPPR